MTQGSNELHFFYDAQNRPAVVVYNGTAYAYVKSLQGDIVAILDENGNTVVSYGYDAWGMPLWCTGELAETLGKVQPFRYRGYVFDEETGLYYLRSRYYNPRWGRFVNADNVLNICATSNCNRVPNAFAYCSNGVIQRTDTDGKLWDIIFDIVSFVGSVVDVIENPTDPWAWASLTGEQIAMSETKLAVVTTASGSLNMRKTASKSAEVIAKIPQGATVTVLMEADGWWRVQYKNSTGWCAAEFLTKQENADNQARMSVQIVDSAGNVFEPVGDFTVKVANADVGDS